MNQKAWAIFSILWTLGAVVGFYGCDELNQTRIPKADAVAVLMATEGSAVSGTVTFARVKDGVRVMADLAGLPPGAHAIHVHEFGDCRAGDGSLAGGHFNPLGQPHGAPDAEARHMGDLGNVTAGEDGTAIIDVVDPLLTMEGEHTLIGRSVVVHAHPDDFTTQPHGGAGPRLACGAIGLARR